MRFERAGKHFQARDLRLRDGRLSAEHPDGPSRFRVNFVKYSFGECSGNGNITGQGLVELSRGGK